MCWGLCASCVLVPQEEKKSDCVKFVLQASSSYLIMWVSVDVVSAVIIIVIFVVQRWVHSPPVYYFWFCSFTFHEPTWPQTSHCPFAMKSHAKGSNCIKWSGYTTLKIDNKHQTKVSAHFVFSPVCEYSVLVYVHLAALKIHSVSQTSPNFEQRTSPEVVNNSGNEATSLARIPFLFA